MARPLQQQMFLLCEAPVYHSGKTGLDTFGVVALLHCQIAVKLRYYIIRPRLQYMNSCDFC